MLNLGTDIRIYLSSGITDMRKGINGLSILASSIISDNRISTGAMFVFRGRSADRIKILWWDGQGFCLFYKVLDKGKFTWPRSNINSSNVRVTKAQLSMLIEGIDWRNPTWSQPPQYMA
ncbi:IS66 family insertion sequence element accessory protein TnpB [Rickettsiales bacterium]|nr:IS66 family insertion sequence element accessory protein TnpB [Rickettsiales bacterium]